MKFFTFFKKVVFFSVICNNIIFCADKSEDGWIELTKDNIKCEKFKAEIDGCQVYNTCNSYTRLTKIPKFLCNYIGKNVLKNKKIFKNAYNGGYSIIFSDYFKIVYNVIKDGDCIKKFEQAKGLDKGREYSLLQEIVFPAVLTCDYEKDYINFDFLDEEFYNSILSKKYFKKVKFKDGTLSIDVDLEELLKKVKRKFIFHIEKGITVPFGINEDSFNAAEKKFFKKEFSKSEGFKEFYYKKIYEYDDMSRFEIYFNFDTSHKVVPVLSDSYNYTINIAQTISEVNCKSGKFNGELYPDLYYFYSNTIDNFVKIEKLLENNTNSYKWFFEKYITKDNFEKLLKEKELFYFYKVIESIKLNEIKKYSVFFRNIVYFIKNHVIPYEETLLFNELKKIEFKEYLNAKETNVEDFFYNKAFKIIKSKDSVFKDFYTLFFYDKTKNQITGVYFDDLSKKDELKMDLVKLFSLEKLIDNFKNEYIKINKKADETLKDKYGTIKVNEFLKEQFINIIKGSNEIAKDIKEDFINSKNFNLPISEYITWYCKEIYKEKFWSDDKNTLKSFILKLNKKDELFEEIKTKTEALKIDKESYDYFSENKLKSLISDMKDRSLGKLSEIFVKEVIEEQKGEINSVSDNIKKLKEKITYYSEKVDDKLLNIVTLLEVKKESESMNDVIFSGYDISNISSELNSYINEKLENKKNTIITAFVNKQIVDIENLKDLKQCSEYLASFNKPKDEAGSIKYILKDKLNTEGFEDVDIKDADYNLADLQEAINKRKSKLEASLTAKMVKEDKDKLENIKTEIKKISDNIINNIKSIKTKEDLKKSVYDSDSVKNDIKDKLANLKIDNYNEFLKNEITGSDPKQTFGGIIDLDIEINVNKILDEYKKIEDSLYVVNINYTLSDEDKITDKGKNEFNKLTDEKYKKFDSRKTYKELFGTLKSVSAYFKNIDLVDSGTLTSIENNDTVIDKDKITINIKLFENCYKKDDPKDPKGDDYKGPDHNKDDHKDHEDNKDSENSNVEITESGDMQKKGKNKCYSCYNNKNKNNTCCVKKVPSR